MMMRVDGDSIEDAGILNGDLLVVDRSAKPVSGFVVAVALNGEYTFKRLRRCPDCVWLERPSPLIAHSGRHKRRAACLPCCETRDLHFAMSRHPVTPDGRYFVVRGRLWRCSNPQLSEDERQRLTAVLMAARRAKGIAMRAGDERGRELARQQVDAAKIALGERGPVWWNDGEPDVNRHMVKNTSYAAWFNALEHGEHG